MSSQKHCISEVKGQPEYFIKKKVYKGPIALLVTFITRGYYFFQLALINCLVKIRKSCF